MVGSMGSVRTKRERAPLLTVTYKLNMQKLLLEIYWGKKGAGKTHVSSKQIVKQYLKGLDTGTNIHINVEALPKTKTPGRIYHTDNPEDIRYFRGSRKRPVLWVLDESYRFFNSRKWKDLPEGIHELYGQCRKIYIHVIIIAQGWRRIDLVLREIADVFVRFEKILFGYGYKEIRQELDPMTDQLIPYGTLASEDKGSVHFYGKRHFKVYQTDQVYGSLLLNLEPKPFYDLVSKKWYTLPDERLVERAKAHEIPHLKEDGQRVENGVREPGGTKRSES